mmetsp:Transcript_39809/g.89173  ORF Transcript_39809/g.89173 Transcript_39809/m.89173 type:complete len:431 (-) Transcript_39809:1159-2451(-)
MRLHETACALRLSSPPFPLSHTLTACLGLGRGASRRRVHRFVHLSHGHLGDVFHVGVAVRGEGLQGRDEGHLHRLDRPGARPVPTHARHGVGPDRPPRHEAHVGGRVLARPEEQLDQLGHVGRGPKVARGGGHGEDALQPGEHRGLVEVRHLAVRVVGDGHPGLALVLVEQHLHELLHVLVPADLVGPRDEGGEAVDEVGAGLGHHVPQRAGHHRLEGGPGALHRVLVQRGPRRRGGGALRLFLRGHRRRLGRVASAFLRRALLRRRRRTLHRDDLLKDEGQFGGEGGPHAPVLVDPEAQRVHADLAQGARVRLLELGQELELVQHLDAETRVLEHVLHHRHQSGVRDGVEGGELHGHQRLRLLQLLLPGHARRVQIVHAPRPARAAPARAVGALRAGARVGQHGVEGLGDGRQHEELEELLAASRDENA